MFLQNFPLAIDLLASAQFILCLRGQTLSLIPRKKPHGHFCFDWGREVMGSWMAWVSLVLGINSTDGANTLSERGLFKKSMFCDSSLQCIKHPRHTSTTNLLSEYLKESLWAWKCVVGFTLPCEVNRTSVPKHHTVSGVWSGPRPRKHWIPIQVRDQKLGLCEERGEKRVLEARRAKPSRLNA